MIYANEHSATRIIASHSLCHLILTTTTTLKRRNHYPHSTEKASNVQRMPETSQWHTAQGLGFTGNRYKNCGLQSPYILLPHIQLEYYKEQHITKSNDAIPFISATDQRRDMDQERKASWKQ